MSAEPHESDAAAEADGQPTEPSTGEALLMPLLTRGAQSVSGQRAPEETLVADEEPRLLVPRELTPLPLVEQALPVLELFPGIVGRRHRLYKVALLRELQGLGSGRWKIRQIQEAIRWLEGSFVAELVRDLRDVGVLGQDERGYYRLTPESRLITAIIGALTVPDVGPRWLIRRLNAVIELALAGEGGSEAAKDAFRSAVSALRLDRDDLLELHRDGSETALLEAARLAEEHAADMDELLKRHHDFVHEHAADPAFFALEQEALDLIARITRLTSETIALLSTRAEELLRSTGFDRDDIRDFVRETQPSTLASLLAGGMPLPPFVPFLHSELGFELFLEKLGQERPLPPPMPPPRTLKRRTPPPRLDPIAELEGELGTLTQTTSVAELVVRERWEQAVRRENALVCAYDRRRRALPRLEFTSEVEDVRRGGVRRISRTLLHPEEEPA